MSSEERQREVREEGSAPAETEKQESAKAAKAKAGKKKAEEKAASASARSGADKPADEESGRPKTPRKRRTKKQDADAEQEPKPTAEAGGEEAKKPRRRARGRGAGKEQAAEAKEEAAATEAEAEAAEAEGEPEPEDESGEPATRGPRRGAEVTAGRSRQPARRSPEGDVVVRARARYVRCAPRKARLVVAHIRGKSIDEARAILVHTPRAASRDVLKLLDSAVANAENNHELVADELKVRQAFVDEGPTLKRYRPRALGRATRIRKRTSHMTIELTAKE